MASKYAKHATRKATPQSEPIPGKAMVENAAGGFVFQIDDWARLDRFLILGTEGGTYYTGEREITRDNAAVVERCLQSDGARTVNRIVEISTQGRAPKNDPAVFALGMALKLGSPATRALARRAVSQVCRIGTHIFQLAAAVDAFGGWGRGTRRAFIDWYFGQTHEALGLNLVKYQSREGWSHRDLFRKIHPVTKGDKGQALFRWLTTRDFGPRKIERTVDKKPLRTNEYAAVDRSLLPQIIVGFERAQKADSVKEVIAAIEEYGLPRECIPTAFLNHAAVWETLLKSGKGMPFTAMIRNLGKMTEVGLIGKLSDAEKYVVKRLGDADGLKRARVHPIAVLLAARVYAGGHGIRGSLAWEPSTKIIDALDDAFYKAFDFVEPTGKRYLLGLDVSGSMDGGSVAGTPLTPRECVGAMALLTAKTEAEHAFVAYATSPIALNISPKERLDTVCNKMASLEMGGTDSAVPMLYALQHKIPVDVFVSYTDNETWAGAIHPSEALKLYRAQMGIPAKLIVVGVTATECSIADPNDRGMMDVVGFDTAAPSVMADFARG